MRPFWHEVWGSARGPVTRLAPETRIAGGAAVFGACLIAPAATKSGVMVIFAALLSWLLACRPPKKTVGAFLLLGLLLFLPYLLVTPLIEAPPSSRAGAGGYGLSVVWSLLAHGLSAMLVSMATVTCLSASDLREGLGRLPIPRVVSSILLQIVHQTGTLIYETRRIASAMAVRGASGGGLTAWRILWSLPRVWLPKVILRAERVAQAMELRGYSGVDLEASEGRRRRLGDAVALVLASGVLAGAILVRWWSPT